MLAKLKSGRSLHLLFQQCCHVKERRDTNLIPWLPPDRCHPHQSVRISDRHCLSYSNYHRTRLDRLDYLTEEGGPFYIQIAPSSPHVNEDLGLTVPLKRHVGQFPNAMAPRIPSYNPADDIQDNKRNWMRGLPLMNETRINATDFSYQARVEALQGVDEIIQDVIALLEKKGIIDNTYSESHSDNQRQPLTVFKSSTPPTTDTTLEISAYLLARHCHTDKTRICHLLFEVLEYLKVVLHLFRVLILILRLHFLRSLSCLKRITLSSSTARASSSSGSLLVTPH